MRLVVGIDRSGGVLGIKTTQVNVGWFAGDHFGDADVHLGGAVFEVRRAFDALDYTYGRYQCVECGFAVEEEVPVQDELHKDAGFLLAEPG